MRNVKASGYARRPFLWTIPIGFANQRKQCYNFAMSQQEIPSTASVHRCPNCGTRVAQNAETCYFCGYDLVNQPRRRRRITWIDLLLAVGLLAIVVVWWRMGSQPQSQPAAQADTTGIVETPVATAEAAATLEPTAISTEPSPQSADVAPPQPTSMVIKHTVRPGETLISIAGLYGVTVEEIQAANNLENELIRAGDELIIPVSQSVAAGTNEVAVPSVFNYVVQPGDTVVSIAVRFGTQVDAILDANNMGPSDFIRPNQVLAVPVSQVPSVVIASSESADAVVETGTDRNLYEAPRLIGPKEGETLARSQEVLLRWVSVDILAPNEWYVLRVWPTQGTLELPPPVWTKATSYRLGVQWAPPSGTSMTYGWQVTVVRVLPDQGEGREIQSASAPSDVRTFVWR